MVRVVPFHGLRYDPARVPLAKALCPPYDVIGPALARRLRALPHNAIHIELPAGTPEGRYGRAAAVWRKWLRGGVLARESEPAYFLVEQRFRYGGRSYRRLGLLAGLGLRDAGPRQVRPHEKTLAKPKADRLRLISTLQVNTSPIFALYPDANGRVRGLLERAARERPVYRGTAVDGVRFRIWRVAEPALRGAVEAAFRPKTLLIADGHHRFEVARAYFRGEGGGGPRGAGASSILAYLCAEEDRGLLVLPTHRVIAPAGEVPALLARLCRLSPRPSLAATLTSLARQRDPYAFGVAAAPGTPGLKGFYLAVPRSSRGVRSGLGVEWLAKNLVPRLDPHAIRYTHEAREAVEAARASGGLALLVKPAGVAQIRRAVDAVGLLPQKSTYFYPKIATGIVFKPLR